MLSAEEISDKGFLISYLSSLRTKPADSPLSQASSDGKLLSVAKSAPAVRQAQAPSKVEGVQGSTDEGTVSPANGGMRIPDAALE